MKEKYIRDLEKNNHSLDGLLEAIDSKTLKVIPENSEDRNLAYVLWKENSIGIAFHSIMDFLMLRYFDDKIIDRLEYIRELWQNIGEKEPKKTSFIYGLTSNYYGNTIKELLENYKDDYGYTQTRFKNSVNPKKLDKIHLDFLIYMAICEVKYGQYNHMKSYNANEHLKFAKQIDSKLVNQLKKIGTGDIPKEKLIHKTETLSCSANDIFANITITVKEESEENFKQALDFILTLMRLENFPKNYSLKYSGTNKISLPIKGLPKKPPHFFFARAIQFKSLHPLIEEYATLTMSHEDIWYENIPNENPARTGTFAVLALGLESTKHHKLVLDYLKTVDFEHQYLQDNYIPVLVEKFGLTKIIHQMVILCICNSDNFKASKILSTEYNTPQGIRFLQQDTLEKDSESRIYKYLFKNKVPKELSKK